MSGDPIPQVSLLYDAVGQPVTVGPKPTTQSLPVVLASDQPPQPVQVQLLQAVQDILANLNVMVLGEPISGMINGVNRTFVAVYQYRPKMTQLYLNGVRLREGPGLDYVENLDRQSITLAIAPSPGDSLLMDYIRL